MGEHGVPVDAPPLLLAQTFLLLPCVVGVQEGDGARRHGVPVGAVRSTFAILVLTLDAFVVLFAGALSVFWALWQLIWLAVPALVTAVALFEIQRQRAAHSPPPAYWDGS
jgi:hypothetical protein